MMTPTTQMFLTLKCLFDMAKGIDQKFVHYGIRKDDLAMIESICDQEGDRRCRICQLVRVGK